MPEPLRPLSAGQLLDRTFQLYRRHFLVFMAIAALPNLLLLLVRVPFWALNLSAGSVSTVASIPGPFVLVVGLAGGLVVLVLTMILNAVATGASTFAVSDAYLGEKPTVSSCFSRMRGRVGQTISASFQYGLWIVLGGILFIIPMFYFIAKYALAVPAAVLEDIHGGDGIRRSGKLTEGAKGRVLLVYLLLMILVVAVSLLLSWGLTFAGFIAHGGGTVPTLGKQIVAQLLQTIANALCFPFASIALTLLYYDQRVRKEAFDIDQMLRILGQAPAGQASAAGMAGN